MRALVLQEFGRIAVEERPTPRPREGEILIAVTATGICGSDVHGFTGENGRRFPGQIMGHESVGRIADFGPGANRNDLVTGAVVTFNPVVVSAASAVLFAGREQHSPDKWVLGVAPDIPAGFADYVVVPARNVVQLPDGIPVNCGALVEPFAVAVHAVRRVQAVQGQRALVVGGGPIGQSVTLALQMAGIDDVMVSEVDANRRNLIEQLGGHAVDPRVAPLAEQVGEYFGGLADVTVDAVGITASVADSLTATSAGGSVCLVGMGSPGLRLDAFRISTDERTLIGSFTYSAQDFNDAAGWIGRSPNDFQKLISREVTPGEANDAFKGLAAGDGTAGKVLVRFD